MKLRAHKEMKQKERKSFGCQENDASTVFAEGRVTRLRKSDLTAQDEI